MRFGHLAVGFFADKEMMVAATGNLRQVGHTHHLSGLAKLAQQFTYYRRGRAANTDIHFIEDQRRGFHFLRRDHLNREGDTRQLTAGRDAGNSLEWLAWVGGHAEFNAICTFSREVVGFKLHINGENTMRHRQQMHALCDVLTEFLSVTLTNIV